MHTDMRPVTSFPSSSSTKQWVFKNMNLAKCCVVTQFWCLVCCHLRTVITSSDWFLPGFYSGGVAEPGGDTHHPDFLSEKEVSWDNWFLQEFYSGGGRGRRHVLFCPNGHQAAWTSSSECLLNEAPTYCELCHSWWLCPESQIWMVVCINWPSFMSVVDVRGEDWGVHLPAGRGWKDRVIFDALCHHQSPVAAPSRDHTLHQPAQRTSSQRSHGGPFRHSPTFAVWVWGKVTG